VGSEGEPHLSSRSWEDPECPGCKSTMRLIGRENHSEASAAEVLTFECDCGQLLAFTTNQ